MNREEMLKELKDIDLRAVPTVATMDMGLQYDYATSEGAGTGFGGMGDWPAYMFNSIAKEQWLKIRKAIKENTLAVSDLKGTGLDDFLGNVKTISDKDKVIPSEVLEGLLTLPEDHADAFFCMFDAGQWYDKYADKPEFFTSENELKEAFIKQYVDDLTRWEEMDDEELTDWYNRLHDEMEEFTIYTYDPEEQE